MCMNIPDHPDVASALRTGYPLGAQESKAIKCDYCGKELSGDDYVFDYGGSPTCEECLMENLKEDYAICKIAEQFGLVYKTATEAAREMEESK